LERARHLASQELVASSCIKCFLRNIIRHHFTFVHCNWVTDSVEREGKLYKERRGKERGIELLTLEEVRIPFHYLLLSIKSLRDQLFSYKRYQSPRSATSFMKTQSTCWKTTGRINRMNSSLLFSICKWRSIL
jgi:hypothetical protein